MALTLPGQPEVQWLTTTEVHEQTLIPTSTLHSWATSENSPIRTRRIGKKWMWLREDVVRLLTPPAAQ